MRSPNIIAHQNYKICRDPDQSASRPVATLVLLELAEFGARPAIKAFGEFAAGGIKKRPGQMGQVHHVRIERRTAAVNREGMPRATSGRRVRGGRAGRGAASARGHARRMTILPKCAPKTAPRA